MFEFIKKKVRKMSEVENEEKKEVKKKAPTKKKAPVKKKEVSLELAEGQVMAQKVVMKHYSKNLCLGKDDKIFLTIEEDGKMIFNKNDFPGWKVENFAREFVKIVEDISGKLK
jgi:ribosomal protein L27